jgi:hypothetical protein
MDLFSPFPSLLTSCADETPFEQFQKHGSMVHLDLVVETGFSCFCGTLHQIILVIGNTTSGFHSIPAPARMSCHPPLSSSLVSKRSRKHRDH